MLKSRGQLDLAEEARDPVRAAELGPDDLDRDGPAVAQVFRQVHGGHAAGADLALELVAFAERRPQPLESICH